MFQQICFRNAKDLHRHTLKGLHAWPLHKQRGASLFTVFILLLLTALLVLGALRVSVFNESIVGNQADQQRAYAAAEALMQHAANDIYSNGPHCTSTECRYPRNAEEFNQLSLNLLDKCGTGAIGSNSPRGVCIPSSPDARVFQTDYINNKPAGETQDIQMSEAAALDYSSFASTGQSGQSSLALGAQQGQYWVEIFRYNKDLQRFGFGHAPLPDNMPKSEPDQSYPFIYRITVRAQGLKPGSVVVLRSFYVPVHEIGINTTTATPGTP